MEVKRVTKFVLDKKEFDNIAQVQNYIENIFEA